VGFNGAALAMIPVSLRGVFVISRVDALYSPQFNEYQSNEMPHALVKGIQK
jgi:hypothetical protein